MRLSTFAPFYRVNRWARLALVVLCLGLVLAAPRSALANGEEPTLVEVGGGPLRFQYLVGGVPTVIRGMGYNAIYHELPPATRLARLNHDFAMLHATGVNTLISWYPEEFDHVLLQVAQVHGIGVIMPFDLPTTADYADPAVQADLEKAVLAWVAEYRAEPAVRMWGIGNEVMLNMDDPQARAFAEFYADLVWAVRDADKDHPVIYREAEDVFVPYLREAMQTIGVPSGFVYGLNAYTPRLGKILESWAEHDFDVPLLVSEFAPAGVRRADRGKGFRSMWSTIQAHGDLVLGAAPYVWTTEGPESVDRLFGFVDAEGRPVDESLAVLRELYGGQGDLAQLAAPLGIAPSVVGLPEAEVRRQIGNAGLGAVSVRYVGPSEAPNPTLFDRLPPGVVLVQDPAPGADGAGKPTALIVTANVDGTAPAPVPLDLFLDDVVEHAAAYAAATLNVSREDLASSVASQRGQGLHQQLAGMAPGAPADPVMVRLADLVAWSKVLSEVTVDARSVFPGAREALPLLAGMSRWGLADGESLDTAQHFLRDVLLRDLYHAPPPRPH